MGFAFGIGNCYACGQLFTFNPMKVPSTKDKDEVRQPVCASCLIKWNASRVENGLPAIPALSGAYEPCDENELVF